MASSSRTSSGNNAQQHPPNATDLALLDKLVTTLLERKVAESSPNSSGTSSTTLNKLRPLSRSLSRSFRLGSLKRNNNANNNNNNSTLPTIAEALGGAGGSQRSANDNAVKPSVKSVINTIKNAPQRFSTANDDDEESKKSLTQNILT